MIAAFRALSGLKKVLWVLAVILTPLFIISSVSPTPGMQKTADVYKADDVSTASVEKPADIPPAPKALQTETKTVNETVPMPYISTTQEDPALEAGKTIVATRGANGEKIITYSVTYTDGNETGRLQVGERVTKQPLTEVKKIGTKPKTPSVPPKPSAPQCDYKLKKTCPPTANSNECGGQATPTTQVFGGNGLLDIRVNLHYSSTDCEL